MSPPPLPPHTLPFCVQFVAMVEILFILLFHLNLPTINLSGWHRYRVVNLQASSIPACIIIFNGKFETECQLQVLALTNKHSFLLAKPFSSVYVEQKQTFILICCARFQLFVLSGLMSLNCTVFECCVKLLTLFYKHMRPAGITVWVWHWMCALL